MIDKIIQFTDTAGGGFFSRLKLNVQRFKLELFIKKKTPLVNARYRSWTFDHFSRVIKLKFLFTKI